MQGPGRGRACWLASTTTSTRDLKWWREGGPLGRGEGRVVIPTLLLGLQWEGGGCKLSTRKGLADMPTDAPKGMSVVDQTCLHMGFTWAKGRERGGGGRGQVESNQENCQKGWPHNPQPHKLRPRSPSP